MRFKNRSGKKRSRRGYYFKKNLLHDDFGFSHLLESIGIRKSNYREFIPVQWDEATGTFKVVPEK